MRSDARPSDLTRAGGVLRQRSHGPCGVGIVNARHEQGRTPPILRQQRINSHTAVVERRRHERQRRDSLELRQPATSARFAPSDAPATPIAPGLTSAGWLPRYAIAAVTASCQRVSSAGFSGRAVPGRSMASALIFTSANRCAAVCHSSRDRPSIGTRTTAGAGRSCASIQSPDSMRPSPRRNVTTRPAASGCGCATPRAQA